MYLQVFMDLYNDYTYIYGHIPTHNDIPAFSLHILHVTMCRYYLEIPTEMAPTLLHTYKYLPTGSLKPRRVLPSQGLARGARLGAKAPSFN